LGNTEFNAGVDFNTPRPGVNVGLKRMFGYGGNLPTAQGGLRWNWEAPDSALENVLEVFDPTGLMTWDDLKRDQRDGVVDPFNIIGVVPAIGKLKHLKYFKPKTGINLMKGSRKAAFDKLQRNLALVKSRLNKYDNAEFALDAVDAVGDIYQDNIKPIVTKESFKQPANPLHYRPQTNDEINFQQELDRLNLFKRKKGGYTVTRSTDRKGKTHKVTGPDGSVKYFGDPNMGERSKSKYGKEAFYKRHAKNLKKNPHFRAYARATWQDGGKMPFSFSPVGSNYMHEIEVVGSSIDPKFREYADSAKLYKYTQDAIRARQAFDAPLKKRLQWEAMNPNATAQQENEYYRNNRDAFYEAQRVWNENKSGIPTISDIPMKGSGYGVDESMYNYYLQKGFGVPHKVSPEVTEDLINNWMIPNYRVPEGSQPMVKVGKIKPQYGDYYIGKEQVTVIPHYKKPSKTVIPTDTLWGWMTSRGMDASFNARKEMAERAGISNYKGTEKQNLELFEKLKDYDNSIGGTPSLFKKVPAKGNIPRAVQGGKIFQDGGMSNEVFNEISSDLLNTAKKHGYQGNLPNRPQGMSNTEYLEYLDGWVNDLELTSEQKKKKREYSKRLGPSNEMEPLGEYIALMNTDQPLEWGKDQTRALFKATTSMGSLGNLIKSYGDYLPGGEFDRFKKRNGGKLYNPFFR
jgi:hypothetical protein